MKKLVKISFSIGLSVTAIAALVACTQSFSQTANSEITAVNASEKKYPILLVNQSPYRFSMYPIYKSKSQSLVFFQIETLKDKTFIGNAYIEAEFIAKDGDLQKEKFKLDSKNRRYIATLPLKHHEEYMVKADVHIPGQKEFSPQFSFHCADPLPELDWLTFEAPDSK